MGHGFWAMAAIGAAALPLRLALLLPRPIVRLLQRVLSSRWLRIGSRDNEILDPTRFCPAWCFVGSIISRPLEGPEEPLVIDLAFAPKT